MGSVSNAPPEIDRMLYMYEGQAYEGDTDGFGRFIHGYLDYTYIGYFSRDSSANFFS